MAIINGTDNNDTLFGTPEDDTLFGFLGNDTLNGGNGNDTLIGDWGTDWLDGGDGADVLVGGRDSDSYFVDNVGDVVTENANEGSDQVLSVISWSLGANLERLDLIGSAVIDGTGNELNNGLFGNSAANVLTGLGGDDAFVGGDGADILIGGTGNDTYYAGAGDTIVENVNEGTDEVVSDVSWTLGANLERLTLTGTAAIDGTGNELNNTLVGNKGANVLTGGAGDDLFDGKGGADIFVGGMGNDWYIGGTTIVEQADEGIDTVLSAGSFNLGANVENLTLTSSLATHGNGNELNNILVGSIAQNVLFGYAGNDFLDGGDGGLNIGTDTLIGGTGDDTYVVDYHEDVVIEQANEGIDRVLSSFSYVLGSNVEDLTLTGGAIINGTGNGLNNSLIGNSAANILTGGTGTDSMLGGNGNDTYLVDIAGDVVTENADEGIDLVQSSADYTLGANVENLTLTGGTAINGTGNELNNTLIGNSASNLLTGGAGDDLLDGGAGMDILIGGTGDDTYGVGADDIVEEQANEGTDRVQSSVSWTLGANVENLTLTGGTEINGTGNELNNILAGNSVANLLDGGAGTDTMLGGGGNDTYVVDNAGDIVTEYANEGADDTVQSSVSWTLGANVENLTLAGSVTTGTGNGLSNRLVGNNAANVLDGGAGTDTMLGGNGNDIYVVDDAGDVVTENANEGTDLVRSFVSWTLASNIEKLELLGITAINGIGNGLNNTLSGNSAANLFAGGAGDDTYGVGAGDTVVEASNEGTDLVLSGVSWILDAHVENLTLTGSTAINGTGNGLNNTFNGNSAANLFTGGAGDDTYGVGTGDTVVEASNEGTDLVLSGVSWILGAHVENLTLTGSTAINGTGNGLNNKLVGNSGVNVLTGGAGDDTYGVSASDTVVENANEGTDLVLSDVSWTLGANLEKLSLTGSGSIDGIGNELNNTLIGNSAANVLTGLTGDDVFNGGAGVDVLVGGTGHDIYYAGLGDTMVENAAEGTDQVFSDISWTLNAHIEKLAFFGTAAINGTGNSGNNIFTGNSAANVFTGGAGDDTYGVAVGDTVVEQANEGIDLVLSNVSFTLGANIEKLTLTGSAANGTGNELNNTLVGNSGANVLTGGAGDDTYGVSTGDIVVEQVNEGVDHVLSDVSWTLGANIEKLTLTGAGVINGTGNSLTNTLIGNSAANVLAGGVGNDTLAGGLGNDTYLFNRGDGQDLVSENDGNVGNIDRLLFGNTINPIDLVFSRQINDLRIALHGTTERVTIQNWYGSPISAQVEDIRAGNGQTLLLNTQVNQLIQAMATFSQQTGLTWDQAIDQQPQAVQTILAASWQ